MSKVSQILASKGGEVWSVAKDTSVFDSLALMAKKNVGALLVLEEGGVLGIFSERDYARKVVLEGRSSKDTLVSEVMTEQVITVEPDENIESCMNKMSEHRIRHLPVIEEGKLRGIISIGDVVNFIIGEQQFKIDQLENYIQGS